MKSKAPSPVLVTLPADGDDRATLLCLPFRKENLYLRVTRRSALGDVPLERAVAEVLCSLLQHAPSVRAGVLRSLAQRSGVLFPADAEAFTWRLDTEQPLRGKRDDLRIVGERTGIPALLWTFELKVFARFHESADMSLPQGGSPKEINQIVTYDRWLRDEQAESKLGVVIGVDDLDDELVGLVAEHGLKERWIATTWTALARLVEVQIEGGLLSDTERFLARHFCGFARAALWNEEEDMGKREGMEFDEVALLRAHRVFGKALEKKLSEALRPLQTVIESCGFGVGKAALQNNLYSGLQRMVVYKQLIEKASSDTPPALYVGFDIARSALVAWVETPASHPRKKEWRVVVAEVAKHLPQRTPQWEVQEAGGWPDLARLVPLEDLLGVEELGAYVAEFAKECVADLRAVEITERAGAVWKA